MRDAYVGDITDLLKFSLLRALARNDRSLGISWYFLEGRENNVDGRHLEWCDEEQWRLFDCEVHAWLRQIAKSDRTVAALEDSDFWKQASYFNARVPDYKRRAEWSNSNTTALEACDLIFLDPDNGIRDGSRKHASFAEISQLYREGRTLICISFPHFGASHKKQLACLQRKLQLATGCSKILTLRTSVSVPAKRANMTVPRARWFTVIGYDQELFSRIDQFRQRFDSLQRASAAIDEMP